MSETALPGAPRILLVEDEYLIAHDVARILASLGCVVVGPAPDVQTARARLADAAPDAALLDVKLGTDDDYALADQLAEQGAPFAFVTGYDISLLPSRFQDRPHLEKPLDSAKLRAVLQRLGVLPA